MKRFWVLNLLPVLLAAWFGISCGSSGSSSQDGGESPLGDGSESLEGVETFQDGIDQTNHLAPVFGGLQEVKALENSVMLFWKAASDTADAPEYLVYDVYLALTAGAEQFLDPPLLSTPPGANSVKVENLIQEGPYYFVVRARDREGNQDDNRIEKAGWVIPVRFVSPGGRGDGTRPDSPTSDIQSTMNSLSGFVQGKTYVSQGEYTGPFKLVRGVELLGGYNPDFSERDIAQFKTVLQGSGVADEDVVAATDNAVLEGFTVQGAVGDAVGVRIFNASPIISKNTITQNYRSGIYIGTVDCGIFECEDPDREASVEIYKNTIIGNGHPGCKRCISPESDPECEGKFYFLPNTIFGGDLIPCGGVFAFGFSSREVFQQLRFVGNTIGENQGPGISFEYYLVENRVLLEQNRIVGNTLSGVRSHMQGGEGSEGFFRSRMLHNRVFGNLGQGLELLTSDGGTDVSFIAGNFIGFNGKNGISAQAICYVDDGCVGLSRSLPSILNNIILSNFENGIQVFSEARLTQAAPKIANNTILGNHQAGIFSLIGPSSLNKPEVLNSSLMNNHPDLGNCSATYSFIQDQDPPIDETNITGNPKFMNLPALFDFTSASGTASSLVVLDSSLYASLPALELSGDGICREVTSIDSATSLSFSPALESASGPGLAVWGFSEPGCGPIDLHLQSDSALIDAGNPDAVYNDLIPPGLGSARNDIGAFGGPQASEEIPVSQ